MATLSVKNLDDELHIALKIRAAEEKTTIQDLVGKAVAEFMAKGPAVIGKKSKVKK